MVMEDLMTLVKLEQILSMNQAQYFTKYCVLGVWLINCRLQNENCFHYLTKLNISRNTVSWVFKNVVILIETMVMDVLMTLVK